ncbi:MAG: transposase [Melioribacteraceae bacterium]|nr:transposase [Melioribacteraceae bacterium]
MFLKTFSMNPIPKDLSNYMQKQYPKGQYYSVYFRRNGFPEAGFSGYGIHRELEMLGFQNIIVSPTNIPTSSRERLRKTDEVDSRKLARELENDSLSGIYIEELLELRARLLKTVKSLRKYSFEYNMDEDIKLLIGIPGIWFITAITLYTEIMNIERFTSLDKIASYIGLVPTTKSSGEKEKVLGLTVQYNRYLRSLLIESSWVAIRKDPALTLAYNDYTKRMSKQESIIRIAKKLLNRIYYVLKNKKEYVYSIV